MGRRPLPASPPLLLLLLLSACAVGAGVFISNLDSVCVRCLCEAASNCNETVGCHKGYCGPFFISRNYWLDAGGRPLPGDDPDRSEGLQRRRRDGLRRLRLRALQRRLRLRQVSQGHELLQPLPALPPGQVPRLTGLSPGTSCNRCLQPSLVSDGGRRLLIGPARETETPEQGRLDRGTED
ncbi:uncharacterized protein LOC134542938 isoform X1 [Bacillus rossius redtenbacheri]|uniref:uncharacterized protein LOC134542938 isoform X1 n=1 Tax=Bacillus rossius redtenbacheri TaxID=93214 RepID=UPI002FDDA506